MRLKNDPQLLLVGLGLWTPNYSLWGKKSAIAVKFQNTLTVWSNYFALGSYPTGRKQQVSEICAHCIVTGLFAYLVSSIVWGSRKLEISWMSSNIKKIKLIKKRSDKISCDMFILCIIQQQSKKVTSISVYGLSGWTNVLVLGFCFYFVTLFSS